MCFRDPIPKVESLCISTRVGDPSPLVRSSFHTHHSRHLLGPTFRYLTDRKMRTLTTRTQVRPHPDPDFASLTSCHSVTRQTPTVSTPIKHGWIEPSPDLRPPWSPRVSRTFTSRTYPEVFILTPSPLFRDHGKTSPRHHTPYH